VACRQLGFEGGEFRGLGRMVTYQVENIYNGTLRPTWLADLPCATGTEATLQECGDLAFGDTASCGLTQRLVCSNGAQGASAVERVLLQCTRWWYYIYETFSQKVNHGMRILEFEFCPNRCTRYYLEKLLLLHCTYRAQASMHGDCDKLLWQLELNSSVETLLRGRGRPTIRQ